MGLGLGFLLLLQGVSYSCSRLSLLWIFRQEGIHHFGEGEGGIELLYRLKCRKQAYLCRDLQ